MDPRLQIHASDYMELLTIRLPKGAYIQCYELHCKNRIVIKMFVSWDSLQNFVKIIFFPQIDSCLCYFEYFLCEITSFFFVVYLTNLYVVT